MSALKQLVNGVKRVLHLLYGGFKRDLCTCHDRCCGSHELFKSKHFPDIGNDNQTDGIAPCYVEAVLIWGPHAFLWLALVPYLVYVSHRTSDPPLPWSVLHVLKTLCSLVLACLAVVQLLVTRTGGYTCNANSAVPSATHVATGVTTASYLLTLVLQQLMRRTGIKSSGVPFCFWAMSAVSNVIPLYVVVTSQVWCDASTVLCMSFTVLWVQLVLHCFADQYNDRDIDDRCPEEDASILNKITYTWITPLVVTAFKRTLTKKDLWRQAHRLQSRTVVPKLLENWRKAQRLFYNNAGQKWAYTVDTDGVDASEKTPLLESVQATTRSPPPTGTPRAGPSLFTTLFRTFGWLWLEACGYQLVGDTFNLLQPVILKKIISVAQTRHSDAAGGNEWTGYSYAVSLFVTSVLTSLLYQCAFNHVVLLGIRIKAALIGTVYRKSLTMSPAAKKGISMGEVVTLMSVDCQRAQDAMIYTQYIFSLPYMVIVSMVQLWLLVDVAMWGGLAVVLVVMVINAYLGRRQQHLQKLILAFKSKRCKILNEIINGIKVLKMYTWETSFQKTVTDIRDLEIKNLRKYAVLTAVSILFAVHSPFMVNYVLIIIHTLTSPIHYLDAQTAFVMLSLVNILQGSISMTPFVINGLIQGWVSTTRIQKFLWMEDIPDDNIEHTEHRSCAISVDNGYFTWDRRNARSTLNRLQLCIEQGQLYAVVGQVGCGKTSLISAILGEMEKLQGTVSVKGSVAYVPQEAWIQNLTVRDNILFGQPMDDERYAKVLLGCALLPDLAILSGGDMTEIGEKGINISGGQKQRVSLARAAYSDADIYLLDDPLSAVDSHVGKHLFTNVIGNQGLLKHKTRVLVTHSIHCLPHVDQIIVLADGHISETGTYNELLDSNGQFSQFLQSIVDNEEQDTPADDTDGVTTACPNDVDIHKHGADGGDVNSCAGQVISGQSAIVKHEKTGTSSRFKRSKDDIEKSIGMSFSKSHHADGKDVQSDKAISKQITEEESQKGSVKYAVFKSYARAVGYIALLGVIVFIIMYQSVSVYSNFWLTYWTEDPLLKNTSLGHTPDYEDKFAWYLVGYTIMGVVQGVAIYAFGILSLTRMVRAAGILHGDMLTCLLHAPMSFFDTTPVGRVMNRFSSDIDVMDNRLPLNFRLWNIYIFSTLATIIVVSINTPYILLVIAGVAVVYLLLLKFFLPTARQITRMESVLRSPIYNHFSETISGVSVIRAYGCVDRFIAECERRVDMNSKFFFASHSASRWMGVRLELLGNLLILAASLFALLGDGLNGAEVGLSITYSLQITLSLNRLLQVISEMEKNIVSAERVKEYTEIEPEAPWSIAGHRPDPSWPCAGSVEFRIYKTRYRPGLDLVLHGIDCNIKPGEKLGIVGRTGAGKSSLALSLFRLIEATEGAIYIDGQDIATIGLHNLRSKLTILPQDPVLFTGSLRQNLDPFGKFDDAAMWKAIECAHLKTAVTQMPEQLGYECGEGGNNLSMGQRQLVCLARTLLHKTRILVLDEATAAVDLETDELIQATIRTEFQECTVLTIAHRLNTILDYDRVMVLGDGLILEIDEPGKLLSDRHSAFYKLAIDAGLAT